MTLTPSLRIQLRPSYIPFLDDGAPAIRSVAAQLEAWALDDYRRRALADGDPDLLRDWAEAAGDIDDDELGVGD